jgi:ketosteroid isomerase-like protein
VTSTKVDVVRTIYGRWGQGDFKTDAFFDPHVVFVLPQGFPDSGRYCGADAVADYTRGFLEPWTHITIESEELVPAGDSVIASVLQRGVGDASGAETEFRYWQVWSFRGETVIRLENFREHDEALEAAAVKPRRGASGQTTGPSSR